mgnify:FL=1
MRTTFLTTFLSLYSQWVQKPLQKPLPAISTKLCLKLLLHRGSSLVWRHEITNFLSKNSFITDQRVVSQPLQPLARMVLVKGDYCWFVNCKQQVNNLVTAFSISGFCLLQKILLFIISTMLVSHGEWLSSAKPHNNWACHFVDGRHASVEHNMFNRGENSAQMWCSHFNVIEKSPSRLYQVSCIETTKHTIIDFSPREYCCSQSEVSKHLK